MTVYADNIVDQYNRPVEGAEVTVWLQDRSDLASLEDSGGSPIANPVLTDVDGGFSFYTEDGVYSLDVAYGGRLRYRDQVIQVGVGIPLPDSVLLQLATDTGGSLIGFKQSGAGAVSRTTLSKLRGAIATLEDFGGGAGKTAAQNASAFIAASSALSAGGEIRLESNGGTYNCNPFTVSSSGITLDLNNSTLSWATLGSGNKGLTITGNNFEIRNGAIQGPASGVYVANEMGIYMAGASTSNRKTGLTVSNVEISNFGAYGIYAQFVDDVKVEGNHIHNCGYSGATFLSCNHGKFLNNKVKTITPGAAGDMYGVSISHDSTGYNVDPNAGTKQATHPFSWDWLVSGNHVENINWEGIDCHGGYEVRIVNNAVYATQRGIAITGSSGDAVAYAGYSNSVIGNTVDGRNADGTTSGYENVGYAINVNGATTTTLNRIAVMGNTVIYKGLGSNASAGVIQAVRATNVVISNNIIDQWQGSAILVTLAGGSVNDNQIGQRSSAGDTIGRCVSDQGPTTYRLSIKGNHHDPLSGTAALAGFVQAAGVTIRPLLSGNRFNVAGTPYSLSATGYCLGDDVTPILNDSTTGTALDVTELEGFTSVVQLSAAAIRTIDSYTGARVGQRLMLLNTGAGTKTVSRTNAALNGSANQSLTTDDIMEIYFTTATTARQIAPVSVNG